MFWRVIMATRAFFAASCFFLFEDTCIRDPDNVHDSTACFFSSTSMAMALAMRARGVQSLQVRTLVLAKKCVQLVARRSCRAVAMVANQLRRLRDVGIVGQLFGGLRGILRGVRRMHPDKLQRECAALPIQCSGGGQDC